VSGAALVLVGTPIGNLGDLSARAATELGAAQVIACEDTRRTGRLLTHLGIPRPRLLVVNEHTEARAAEQVVTLLAEGHRVVLVSDAGMPGLSDPGERLVRAAVDAGHRVEVVPGPAAAITALVVSGLPAGRFCFEGFLARKGRQRTEHLAELARERRTMVLYEAPHRLERTLADLAEALGPDRTVAVARELTKLHEEVFRGTLTAAGQWAADGGARGELVLVVAGATAPEPATDEQLRAALASARAEGLSVKDAAARVAQDLGVAKRRAYELAVAGER
jgi:16S rRNA (cytidine1402-2'-O)-methyltransferase